MPHTTLWETVAQRLLDDYQSIANERADSEMAGRSYEGRFRKFLEDWLPQSVAPLDGAVISWNGNVTGQRDVVIFDKLRTPTFKRREDDISLMPVEGVLGAIEVNGAVVGVEKVRNDMDKIAELKSADLTSRPPSHVGLTPISQPVDGQPPIFRQYEPIGGKFGYVFARDCQVSLETLAGHIRAKNSELGVDASTDAIFILNKGVIFHGNDSGSSTLRLTGTPLYFLEKHPKEVLLDMVALTLQNLRLGASGYIPDTESYFRPPGGALDQHLRDRVQVSDDEYSLQPSRLLVVSS